MKLLATTCILVALFRPVILVCANRYSYNVCHKIAHLQPPRSVKITIRVFSTIPDFKSHQLVLRLNSTDIQNDQTNEEGGYVVIYNTCTDSNQPDMFCKEGQATLGWNVFYYIVSVRLYQGVSQYQELFNLSLPELLFSEETQNPTTTGVTDSTSAENRPETTNANSEDKATENTTCPHSPPTELIVVSTLALLFGVLFLITLLVFIIYVCFVCKKRKYKITNIDTEELRSRRQRKLSQFTLDNTMLTSL